MMAWHIDVASDGEVTRAILLSNRLPMFLVDIILEYRPFFSLFDLPPSDEPLLISGDWVTHRVPVRNSIHIIEYAHHIMGVIDNSMGSPSPRSIK
jgi:hypothetical protein